MYSTNIILWGFNGFLSRSTRREEPDINSLKTKCAGVCQFCQFPPYMILNSALRGLTYCVMYKIYCIKPADISCSPRRVNPTYNKSQNIINRSREAFVTQ